MRTKIAIRRALARSAATMLALSALAPARASAPLPGGLIVERVVMVMRHGVRPPTKDPALPPEIAPDLWPRWPVPPGWLTPHGAEAIRMLGRDDRRILSREGLLPATACPDPDAVAVRSDSDERTIATGDAYLDGLAQGCTTSNHHLPQDAPDPLFHDPAAGHISPAAADRAVADALGPDGLAGVERRQGTALNTIDHILCGDRAGACGVSSEPSRIVPAAAGKLPKLSGALDRGSSVAQSILLEYADGKPLSEVGWGRASARDIERIGALHAQEFAILARPDILAEAKAAGLAKVIIDALNGGPAKLTVIVGHDTNVANVAGLLDLHWKIDGFAADDPAPGGALVFETLRDSAGHRFVRIVYRSQTLNQMRRLSPTAPTREMLLQPACDAKTICSLDSVSKLLSR